MRAWWLMACAALGAACGDDGGGNGDVPDAPVDAAIPGLDVTLDSGPIHGAMRGGARAFLGVPFAAPPVGELRWKPPHPVAAWTDVHNATSVRTGCAQVTTIAGGSEEEDCLFLNVFAPEEASGAPVMVWFHGGGFVFGSGGEDYYAGSLLAKTFGVIVVTVNYRLGPFGFLAHPALTAEDPAYPSSGNYGIDDQISSLQWVQRNIAAFGGDPAAVTIFGESAGGFSACVLYVSPLTTGLFRAAISQSGLCSMATPEATLAQAEALGVAHAENLGCPGTGAAAATCMRGKSVTDVLALASNGAPIAEQMPGGTLYVSTAALPGFPNVDGRLLTGSLRAQFTAGAYAKRPLLLGTNRDEGTLFQSSFFAPPVTTEAEYTAALTRRFGANNVDAILLHYPVASFPDPNRALAEVTGDVMFVCPARTTARAAAAAGVPVYLYSFETEPDGPALEGLGVFHSSEIPFVFGGNTFLLGHIGTHTAVSEAMQGYWTRFAATNDPNGAGAPVWPRYDATTDTNLVLADAITTRMAHKDALCDFWDALPAP